MILSKDGILHAVQGDSLPDARVVIADAAGGAVDLAGCTGCTVTIKPPGADPAYTITGDVTECPGMVRFAMDATSTATAGDHKIEIELHYGSKTQTLYNALILRVRPRTV